jgi:RNA polymerase sigma-70 factor, ECF subfamily
MDTTPASLLDRLRQPAAPAAWERFVDLYTPLLCLWAQRLGVQGADRDDLVQDVFALLVQKLPAFQYRPGLRFRGWLWTVLSNKLREQRRRHPLPVQPDGGPALEELAGPDAAEALDEAEYRQYLTQRALQLMRTDFQPTTWQAFYETVAAGRPAAEVAAELGLRLDAVYTAKSRVLRRLRQELNGLLD